MASRPQAKRTLAMVKPADFSVTARQSIAPCDGEPQGMAAARMEAASGCGRPDPDRLRGHWQASATGFGRRLPGNGRIWQRMADMTGFGRATLMMSH